MISKAVILSFVLSLNLVPASPLLVKRDAQLISDIPTISNYWGQIRPYAANADNYFGVEQVGLPDGCGLESVSILHRHGARYPTGSTEDGVNDLYFAQKVVNATAGGGNFTGPLSFLSNYQLDIAKTGLLTESGAAMEFTSGTTAWNQYGRLLFDAQPGQNYYNASFPNGTARPLMTWRTTSQARILQSAEFFAAGFFGLNASQYYNLEVIPEGGTENNTLASYDSCANDNLEEIGYIGDSDVYTLIPNYLSTATQRLSQYVPSGFNLTTNDTYAMQSLCAYEYNALGSSDFCSLFTLEEWQGFEYTLDVEYYYDYSFANPTGRAQGLGYVQELVARLTNQYVTASNSSVNSSLDDSASTFPLNQAMYLDMSHDDILVSVLTAMSFDYLKQDLPLSGTPNANRTFILSHLTPFGARLNTEVYGCNSADPDTRSNSSTVYNITANGYNPATATNKFIRMRLNNGILPLTDLRGGFCTRADGFCSMDSFLASQQNATALANYQFSCFGNSSQVLSGFNGDGASFA